MQQIKFNPREKWFVPAEVAEPTIYMTGITRCFVRDWPKMGFGSKIKEYISYFRDNNLKMYFKRKEFDASSEFISKKMLNNPDWAHSTIDKIEDWSIKLMDIAKKNQALPVRKMTDEALIKAYKKQFKYQNLQHSIGSAVSWVADADQERVTKAITKIIKDKIKIAGFHIEPAIIFSILSTPTKESFAAVEEKELLYLIRDLMTKGFVKIDDFAQSNEVTKHYNKWCWLAFNYRGPAYSKKYFLDRIEDVLSKKIDPKKALKEITKRENGIRAKQRKLYKLLDFSVDELKLINLTQRITFIKEFRKGALYYCMFCYQTLFGEIAKRLDLTLDHIWSMHNWEIEDFLLKGKLSKKELDKRLKETVVSFIDRERYLTITGKEAERLYNQIPKEELFIDDSITDISGTCASPGKGKGVVKIIETMTDVSKMNQGDILVSETTYPGLVSAMKKAAAIVTNAGGLTCHAAIVSRELGIPCVVGTKIANKVLKDGDLVDVDATKGIVTILRKSERLN
jgi:phosphohistidine swiveling domain-containing protein